MTPQSTSGNNNSIIYIIIAILAFGVLYYCSNTTTNTLEKQLLDTRNELYKIKVKLDSTIKLLSFEKYEEAKIVLASLNAQINELNTNLETGEFKKKYNANDLTVIKEKYAQKDKEIAQTIERDRNRGVAELEAENARLKAENKRMQATIKQLEERNEKLFEELLVEKNENRKKQLAIERMSNMLQQAETEKDKLRNQEGVLRNDINSLDKKLRNEMFNSAEEQRRLNNELDIKKNELAEAERQKQEQIDKFNKYQEELLKQGEFVSVSPAGRNNKNEHDGILNNTNQKQTRKRVRHISVRYPNAGITRGNNIVAKLYRTGSRIPVKVAKIEPVGGNLAEGLFDDLELEKGQYEIRIEDGSGNQIGRTQTFTIF